MKRIALKGLFITGQSSHYCVYYRPFINMDRYSTKFDHGKSVDGMFGIRSLDWKMACANESTELWRPAKNNRVFNIDHIRSPTCTCSEGFKPPSVVKRYRKNKGRLNDVFWFWCHKTTLFKKFVSTLVFKAHNIFQNKAPSLFIGQFESPVFFFLNFGQDVDFLRKRFIA